MAEPSQYTFTLKEALVALLKEQGIHEGRWTLGFGMNINAGLIGPNPTEATPGAAFQIVNVSLTRATEPLPNSALVVDAATLNPL